MSSPVKLGRPIMSGHCAFPETLQPALSHQRCHEHSALMYSKPTGLSHPCPCPCHLGDEYECECGGVIREAPLLGLDEDGDEQYVHIHDGRLTLEGCRT